MTRYGIWTSAVALSLMLSASSSSAIAQDRGSHRERVNRAARGDQQAERRAVPRGNDAANRDTTVNRNDQHVQEVRGARGGNSNHGSGDNHNGNWHGNNRGPAYVAPPVYVAPRVYAPPRVYVAPRHVAPAYVYPVPVVVPPRYPHHYGSGGSFSVFFGIGSGYRYGAPYYGRVYGYSAPAYPTGSYRSYGDVRLQVRPRDAAVYVDGYYAGVVDDFDGVFQRLTVEVGPHEIEIERPGFEPQMFNVYVDPTRTIDVKADLYAAR